MSNLSLNASSNTRACLYLDEVWSTQQSVLIANIVSVLVNTLTCFIAVLGNLSVLLAVRKTPALHTPSNALLCCLCVSDFLVGAMAQPCFIVQNIFEIQRKYSAYCTTRLITDFLTWTCAGASFLTMSAIAVERVLALVLHLRYNVLVTVKRVLIVFLVFCLVCIVLVVSRFFGVSRRGLTTIPIFVEITCITIILGCYFKIFLVIRRLHPAGRLQTNVAQQVNINNYKKFTTTTLYVVVIFLLCYVPFIVAMILFVRVGNTLNVKLAYNYITTLIYLNSSFNAFVYCLRIRSIRRAVLGLYKK